MDVSFYNHFYILFQLDWADRHLYHGHYNINMIFLNSFFNFNSKDKVNIIRNPNISILKKIGTCWICDTITLKLKKTYYLVQIALLTCVNITFCYFQDINFGFSPYFSNLLTTFFAQRTGNDNMHHWKVLKTRKCILSVYVIFFY